MESRREFFKSVAALGVGGVAGLTLDVAAAETPGNTERAGDDRRYWLGVMEKISAPVLENLSRRELKKNMPVETSGLEREKYTHLEAFGRLLAGLAPWLAAKGLDETEAGLQEKYLSLVTASLAAATDPHSPDFMNFTSGGQPLVDAAFLAQGILRAPDALWKNLDPRVQRQLVEALKSTRTIATPTTNNWVMFAAMVEATLHVMGEKTVAERLEKSVERMLGWYKGDGLYGDGADFHFDHYNSFVNHPMLVDVLAVLRQRDKKYESVYAKVLRRARRYMVIQERLIAPDGTFPSVGRSTTYRFGAFHSLAQLALMQELPEPVKPAQVRSGLTAVIRKLIEAPGTFDAQGWLRIGFCGHQPALGENYISTGSLYLCAVAFLPLGLPPADEFWSQPPLPWTSQQIWSGKNLHADHALNES